MHCQTVIKKRNEFRGYVGATTETRRRHDGAMTERYAIKKDCQNGKNTRTL
ncbi:hypothetical protein PG630_01160 [Riemerella anatipestifer]|nr:hypothetical protein [Riemerella anatipestifer]